MLCLSMMKCSECSRRSRTDWMEKVSSGLERARWGSLKRKVKARRRRSSLRRGWVKGREEMARERRAGEWVWE